MAWALWRNTLMNLARKTFKLSLYHLSLLFAALLIDHYLPGLYETCSGELFLLLRLVFGLRA
jgi:heme O synthase-like polyprenyltransferase